MFVFPVPLSPSRADRKRAISSTFTEQIHLGLSDKPSRIFIQPSSGTIRFPQPQQRQKRLRY